MTDDNRANIIRIGTLALVAVNLVLNLLTLQSVIISRNTLAGIEVYTKDASIDKFTGTEAEVEIHRVETELRGLKDRLDELEEVKR